MSLMLGPSRLLVSFIQLFSTDRMDRHACFRTLSCLLNYLVLLAIVSCMSSYTACTQYVERYLLSTGSECRRVSVRAST